MGAVIVILAHDSLFNNQNIYTAQVKEIKRCKQCLDRTFNSLVTKKQKTNNCCFFLFLIFESELTSECNSSVAFALFLESRFNS